jgi:glycosyltransferase involved in cell wall biosynthesis
MTAKRLLFLLNDAPFFVTHRLAVAVAAHALGFEVHVGVPFEARAAAQIRAAGVYLHDIPLRRGARALFGELRLIAAYWRLIGALKPDVVHAVTMKPVLYGGLVARLRGVPAIAYAITGLGYLFLIDGWLARVQRRLVLGLYSVALAHNNARAIFQNPDDRELFLRHHVVRPDITVMIRGCGVDTREFPYTPEPPGLPIVLFPARIIGDKGVREFVAAARQLKAQGVAATFRLLGRTDPDNPTNVSEAEVRAWQAEGVVEWRGFSTEMPAELALSHIVCMPSYREGLPRVLIEAAAVGRPIVTTDVPGCREVVRDGDNGILVPVRNAPALAAALKRLLEDKERRADMGARGRARVLAEFSVEGFVADSLAVYGQVLKDDLVVPDATRARA